MNKNIKELAMHEKDTGSSEIQIALLTEKIDNLSKHIKQFKKIEIKIDRTEWNETNKTKWK